MLFDDGAASEPGESGRSARTTVVEDAEGYAVFAVDIREREGLDFIVCCSEELFQEAFQKFVEELSAKTAAGIATQ